MRVHGPPFQFIHRFFTPARPNDSSACAGGAWAYRRARRHKAGAFYNGSCPMPLSVKSPVTCHLIDRLHSGRQFGLVLLLSQIPAHLVDQPGNLFHLHVIDLFGPVIWSVIVGMQTRMEPECRYAVL